MNRRSFFTTTAKGIAGLLGIAIGAKTIPGATGVIPVKVKIGQGYTPIRCNLRATAANNLSYVIEGSLDGEDWRNIGEVVYVDGHQSEALGAIKRVFNDHGN